MILVSQNKSWIQYVHLIIPGNIKKDSGYILYACLDGKLLLVNTLWTELFEQRPTLSEVYFLV